MSDRGSILISTANDIGEALVEKLGGEGYAPSVWDKEYNKLGIAEVDSAPALSVLENSSETGTSRGSILMSTANAIGSMLNKKYNTDRGFKPKEWASATSKLAPLPEKSAESSPICAIEDGADDVPTKSLVVTIPPTLSGVSSVDVVQTGANLLFNNIEDGTTGGIGYTKQSDGSIACSGTVSNVNATLLINTVVLPIGNYVLSGADNSINLRAVLYDSEGAVITNRNDTGSGVTISVDNTVSHIEVRIKARTNAEQVNTTISPMLAVGSTSQTYEKYNGTTYTASLGRTIYGGTADIVNGTGSDGYIKYVIDGVNVYGSLTGSNYMNIMPYGLQIDGTISKWLCDTLTANTTNFDYNSSQGFIFIRQAGWSSLSGVTDTESFNAYCQLHPITLILPVITPESFTFDGQEIPTKDGYNAFWSDQGNTALDYYGEPEPYTRGTSSGAIANVPSARTDLPFTKVKANIAPNLTGVESVEVTKAGKNLFNKENPNEVDGYITTTGFSTSNTSAKTIYIPIVGGATYTVSKTAGQSFSLATAEVIPSNNAVFTSRQANNTATSISITAGANDKYLWAWIYLDGTDSGTLEEMISSVQIEVGSSASTYTPYEEPTVYTADLGRTIYGGSTELVSGESKETYAKDILPSAGWTYYATAGKNTFNITIPNCKNAYAICSLYPYEEHQYISQQSDKTFMFYASGNNIKISICDNDYTSASDFGEHIGGALLVFEKLIQDNFNIDGQVVRADPGVNNLWNNAGGDTDVEYFTTE